MIKFTTTIRAFLTLSLLFLFSGTLYAYNTVYSPFSGKFDYVGAATTDDITVSCANGLILKSTGTGWACAADDSVAGGGTIRTSEDGAFLVSADTIDFTTGLKASVVAGTKIKVSGDIATTAAPGIASFDATQFSVAPFGGVSITGINRSLISNNLSTSVDVLVAVSHAPVTLAGQNYLTLSGQQITANAINLSGTHVTSTLGAGNGGTGDDTSATTGMPRITAGNWTYDADFRHLASVDVVGVPRGGTGRGVISNDAILVGNNGGDGFDAPPLPNCVDSGGQHLNYTTATGSFSCGTTGDGTGSGGGGFMIRASEDGTFVADNGNRQMNLNFTTGIKASVLASGDTVTVSGDMATTTTPGIASFDSTQFSVGPFGGVQHKASADAVYVGTGSGVDAPALPDCNGTGKALSYTAATNNFTCNTISVSGSASKYVGIFMPAQAKLPLVNPAQIDAGKPGWRLLFDATTGERVSYDTVITPYQGGAVSAEIVWTATSGTSGGVSWALSFDCITSGDNVAVDLGSFSTPNWIVGAAPGTAGFEAFARGSLANFDSCADKDRMRLMVSRDTVSADDTMTGDAELRSVLIYEV